jgi:hypothetical protein
VLRDRVAIIHSGDAIIIMTLNGKYNAILPLKSTLDRFLAVGQSNVTSAESEQLVAMTGTGMMGIKVNIANIAQSDPRCALPTAIWFCSRVLKPWKLKLARGEYTSRHHDAGNTVWLALSQSSAIPLSTGYRSWDSGEECGGVKSGDFAEQ